MAEISKKPYAKALAEEVPKEKGSAATEPKALSQIDRAHTVQVHGTPEVEKKQEENEKHDPGEAADSLVLESTPKTFSTPLEAALEYQRRGWEPIPVRAMDKRPVGLEWQKSKRSEEELKEAFADASLNVGVVLGEPSLGLIDIDLDCEEAILLGPMCLPKTLVFGREGRPRSHWLFKVEPIPKTKKFCNVDGSSLVEIRSTGGQTVFPGSTHPSGDIIHFESGGEPTLIDQKELLQRVGLLAAVALLAHHWPKPGSRQNAALALAGGLLAEGWPVEAVANFLQVVTEVAGDEEQPMRIRAAESTAHKQKQHGHTTGWPTLAGFVGPRVVDSIRDWLPGSKRTSRDSFRLPIESECGRNELPEGFPPEWMPVPLSKLGGDEVLSWLWEGFLAGGVITLLSGFPKCGKTTLLAHLLKHFGEGGQLGGEVKAAKVLVVTEETSALWKSRADNLKIGDHVELIKRPFKVHPTREQWEEFILRLTQLVSSKDYGLVVIDPIASVSPVADENDSAQMIKALQPLFLITDAGAAVLLIHHCRKAAGSHGTATRGSSALPGFVDIVLELRRSDGSAQDNRRTLGDNSRFDETPLTTMFELVENEYRCVGTQNEVVQEDRFRIIEAMLSSDPPGQTVDKLRESWPDCAIPKPGITTFRRDLREGAARKQWSETGEGKKNDPLLYFKGDDSFLSHPLPIGEGNESDQG